MKEELINKIQAYCAKAEKSSADVLKKLKQWGVGESDQLKILQHLRDEGFVDDNRYLLSFVGDKWRIHQWGREKIRLAAEALEIPDADVEQAIGHIPERAYQNMVHDILMKKFVTLTHLQPADIHNKILQYGNSKGFEASLVHEFLEELGLDTDIF